MDEDLFQDCEENKDQESSMFPTGGAGGILGNIQSLVAMLGGSESNAKAAEKDEEKYLDFPVQDNFEEEDNIDFPLAANEDLLAKLHNPNNVKKSFEMKMQTDDEDDEVFIVHEEEEGEKD